MSEARRGLGRPKSLEAAASQALWASVVCVLGWEGYCGNVLPTSIVLDVGTNACFWREIRLGEPLNTSKTSGVEKGEARELGWEVGGDVGGEGCGGGVRFYH